MSRLEHRLHHRAMTLLAKDRRKASPNLTETIKRVIHPCPEDILVQIDKDLSLYPLFDAIAMWCEDTPLALGNFHPPIKDICSVLVSRAEERNRNG